MAMRSRIHGNSEPVEVFTGPSSKKPFRFGNGGVQFSSSYVLVPQRLGEQLVMLGLYTIDAEKVPILIGMKTLVKLGAVIDVYGRWMVLSHVSPEVKIPLAKSKAGHLLVNLTMDWLNVSQPLQSSANDGAYMASAATVDVEQASGGLSRSLDLDFHETSVMPSVSCCLDGVGDVWMIEDDEEEMQDDDMPADDVFLMDQHHAHQPLPSATQEMRDRILQQLVAPNTNSDPRLLSNGSQDGFSREQGQQSEAQAPPTVEKYDWARTQGPDPRDERTLGSPCFGNHVEQPPGKGSTSGSNQWARWTGCAACGLRLSYTPTWGSHGMTRAAGPLCQDVRQQLEIKKPEKGSVELNNKKISYDAQERSLEQKLANVKSKKEEWLQTRAKHPMAKIEALPKGYPKAKSAVEKGKAAMSTENMQRMAELQRQIAELESLDQAPVGSGTMPLENLSAENAGSCASQEKEEDMNKTPGRKSRKSTEPSEELEYNQRGMANINEEEDQWTVMSGSPPA